MIRNKPFTKPSRKQFELVRKSVSRQPNGSVVDFEELEAIAEMLNRLELLITAPGPANVILGWTDVGVTYSIPGKDASMIFLDQYGVSQVKNFLTFRQYEDRPLVPFSYSLLLSGEYLAARGHLGLALFAAHKGIETQRLALTRSGYAVRPMHFADFHKETLSALGNIVQYFIVLHEYGHIVFQSMPQLQTNFAKVAYRLVNDYGVPYLAPSDLRYRGFLHGKENKANDTEDENVKMREELAEEIFCDLYALVSVCLNLNELDTSATGQASFDVMMVLDALDLLRWEMDWRRRNMVKLKSLIRPFSIRRQALQHFLTQPEALSDELFVDMPDFLSALRQLSSQLGPLLELIAGAGTANDFTLMLASSCPSPLEREKNDTFGQVYALLVAGTGGDIKEQFDVWDTLFGDQLIDSLDARFRRWAGLPFTDAIGESVIRVREWFKYNLTDSRVDKLDTEAKKLGYDGVINQLRVMHDQVRNLPQAPFTHTAEGRQFAGVLLDKNTGDVIPLNKEVGHVIPPG